MFHRYSVWRWRRYQHQLPVEQREKLKHFPWKNALFLAMKNDGMACNSTAKLFRYLPVNYDVRVLLFSAKKNNNEKTNASGWKPESSFVQHKKRFYFILFRSHSIFSRFVFHAFTAVSFFTMKFSSCKYNSIFVSSRLLFFVGFAALFIIQFPQRLNCDAICIRRKIVKKLKHVNLSLRETVWRCAHTILFAIMHIGISHQKTQTRPEFFFVSDLGKYFRSSRMIKFTIFFFRACRPSTDTQCWICKIQSATCSWSFLGGAFEYRVDAEMWVQREEGENERNWMKRRENLFAEDFFLFLSTSKEQVK